MRRIENIEEKAPQMKPSNPKIKKLVDGIISDLGVLSNLVQSNPNNRSKTSTVKNALTRMKSLQGTHWS